MPKQSAKSSGKERESNAKGSAPSAVAPVRTKELVEHFKSARCRELALGLRVLDGRLSNLESLSLSGRINYSELDKSYILCQELRGELNKVIVSVQLQLANKKNGGASFNYGMSDLQISHAIARDKLAKYVSEETLNRMDNGVRSKVIHSLATGRMRLSTLSIVAEKSADLVGSIHSAIESDKITMEQLNAFQNDSFSRLLFNASKRLGKGADFDGEVEKLIAIIQSGQPSVPEQKAPVKPAAKKATKKPAAKKAAKKPAAKKTATTKVPADPQPVQEATL